MKIPFCSLLCVILCTPFCLAEKGLQVVLDGKATTVLPVGWTSRRISLLTRGGGLVSVSPDELAQPRVVPHFRPFSQSEMRGEILREFGQGFEVTGTGNYLVVHPAGSRDLWADRFEYLYRSMVHFFRTRGYPMQRPRFPLVGVVLRSKAEYFKYVQRKYKTGIAGSVGVYMHTSNRIYLYDATRGTGRKSAEWEENLSTVMHEAAHQTAFNTGIHTRAAAHPAWIIEGLGCLFEAPGIYNSFQYKDRDDRINPGRLLAYQRHVKSRAAEAISSMVAADKIFRFDPNGAYATAWALTFYLSEREPRKYIRYLKMVSEHKPLQGYDADDRVRDFAQVLGKDYRMLAARVTRLMDELATDLPK